MQDIPNFTELGFGLGSLALIWVVVKYFISSVDKKDLQISSMVEKFNETIDNHIDHQTTQAKKNATVLRKLDKSVVLLIKELKK